MGKPNRRPQTQKDRAMARVMRVQDMRRSSMAEPHRDRSRYSRADFRNMAQRGNWED